VLYPTAVAIVPKAIAISAFVVRNQPW